MADKQTIERLKDQALEIRELVLKLSAKTDILAATFQWPT